MLHAATFQEELVFWKKGKKSIVGLDEVGRGSWAGPVVVAGVIFPVNCELDFALADSKMLNHTKRLALKDKIKSSASSYAITTIPVRVINSIGIGKATQLAFYKTLQKLENVYDFIFIDAFYIDRVNKEIQKPIIHGDQISASIAAASILAKVYRDALMTKLHTLVPEYGFDVHKGYGTKKHQEAIAKCGLSQVHRTSFSLQKYCKP